MRRALPGVRGLLVVVAIACAALPVHASSAAGTRGAPAQPQVSLGYYNAQPGFDFQVTGQHFTPRGRADVFIAENGHLLKHDVVGISAQGTLTDTTGLACDFQTHEARAYDRRSRQWSNTATLGGPCPG